MKLERDGRYWDEFIGMVVATVFTVFFMAYAITNKGSHNKFIGASGSFLFGLLSTTLSVKVRKSDSFLNVIEQVDTQNFLRTMTDAIVPPLVEAEPLPMPEAPPDNLPRLPIPGVKEETQEQEWAKAECPAKAAKNPDKKKLWDYLSAYHPEILMLMQRQLLLVFGEQGSGKTTFVGFLIGLRAIFLEHEIWVADPHANDNRDCWVVAHEVVGWGYDYNAIKKQIHKYFEACNRTDKSPITAVWDEYTNYADRIDGGDQGFVQSALSDARKADFYNIMIGHGDTNATQGGTKGTSKMRDRGQTKILLLGAPDPLGKVTPQGRGMITGLFKNDKGEPLDTPIIIEKWMNPGYLVKLFPELKDKAISPKPINVSSVITTKKETLNDVFSNRNSQNGDDQEEPPEPPLGGKNHEEPIEERLNGSFEDKNGSRERLESLLGGKNAPIGSGSPLPTDWQKVDFRAICNEIDTNGSLVTDFSKSEVSRAQGAIVSAIRFGWSKAKTIEVVLGIKKGSSSPYVKASAFYDEIKNRIS